MRLSRDEFEKLVSKALEDLPKGFRERMENIVVVVEEAPSQEIMRELGLTSPLGLLGLYQGVPLKHRGVRYGNVLPDRIVIYQRPIEALVRTRGELLIQIRRTVMHEIGHFFGLAESDLREIEGDE
ncbi:MAG: metallopeptidase family protein [Syntrophobacterales bacterium]|nr:MAG: metallopeptidase family protein [Syntrophobacterales bacterium]